MSVIFLLKRLLAELVAESARVKPVIAATRQPTHKAMEEAVIYEVVLGSIVGFVRIRSIRREDGISPRVGTFRRKTS